LNIEYAPKIAYEWNVEDVNSGYKGYVLQFEVRDEFIKNSEVRTVGASWHQEYWIPAEDLNKLNEAILGRIIVLEKYPPVRLVNIDTSHHR
jgi:hypothetical protein